MEEEWRMDFADEIESRKKLDEQRNKLQKELRDVGKLSCVSKEVQDSLNNDLQQQLQEVEKRRHVFVPEHQRVQKDHKRYKASRIKEGICKKNARQPKRRCGKSERKLRTMWQMRKWKQNFRDCKLEKKEEVALGDDVGADFRVGSGSSEV